MDNNISMFSEFKETLDRFKYLNEKFKDSLDEHDLPAMVILERNESGENKHAMIGKLDDLFILYEWGINLLCEGYGIKFDKALEILNHVHSSVDHIKLHDLKEEI